ncbi:hypothetical protein BRADI_4g25856v3 [Brachypodium distachyon]|uniref:Uncharacterized protein n=2 Tax=Brachypodium distachyon TaxID=15368 RepID=A0A0Q3EPR0_BRADI|nr:hypothetical protein BRADI_4g25856v3 [Brachypodium distachyon]
MVTKCVMHTQAKPVAQLVGSAADGFQIFVAPVTKKATVESKDAMALVSVHFGEISAEQMVNAFNRMFQWGWAWSAKPFAPGSFLMRFPSVQKIDEINQFNDFCLVGERAEVMVSRWSPENFAQFKLTSVWVKVSGLPDSLLNYQGFCMAGSILGTVQEVDMITYRKMDVIRVRVGVMDHRKIPEWGPLTVDLFIYRVYFQLEQVVELGGPMISGLLVKRASEQHPTEAEQRAGRELKRQRSTQENQMSQEGGKDNTAVGDVTNDKFSDMEEDGLLSSQPDLNGLALTSHQAGKLDGHALDQHSRGSESAIDMINSKFATAAEKIDNLECSEDESEPQSPTQFARDCGLGTQAINEMNSMDYNVESPEHIIPICTPEGQKGDNVTPMKNYAATVMSGQEGRWEAACSSQGWKG